MTSETQEKTMEAGDYREERLAKRLKDPDFREAYERVSLELADAEDSEYASISTSALRSVLFVLLPVKRR